MLTKTANHNSKLEIITDISQYQEIRNHKWSNSEQVKHFPPQIPPETKTIAMAYSPGVRQSSSFFQIRLQKSPEQIQSLLNNYQKIAKHEYQGGDTNDHIQQPLGVPTTFFHTSQSQTGTFPHTYKILVLKAQSQGKPGFKWNHGSSYGVAINSTNAEIIYWAEQW